MEKTLEEGKGCGHLGCLSHITHPCEGCGRTGGRIVSSAEKTLNDTIEFARKHGMTVFVGDITVRVAYPSGEEKTLMRYDPETPRIIADMTCNLF